VIDFKDGRVYRLRDYLDPEEALEAAGPPESA
jgi:ketosteroid isomerase-like protein